MTSPQYYKSLLNLDHTFIFNNYFLLCPPKLVTLFCRETNRGKISITLYFIRENNVDKSKIKDINRKRKSLETEIK